MAKQTKKKTSRSKNTQNSNPLLSIEALAVFLIVYCLLAIFQLGFLGKFFANVIRFFIGDLFVFGGICGILAGFGMLFRGRMPKIIWRWTVAAVCSSIALLLFVSVMTYSSFTSSGSPLFQEMMNRFMVDFTSNMISQNLGGGLIGTLLYAGTYFLVSQWGTYLLVFLLLVCSALLIFDIHLSDVMNFVRTHVSNLSQKIAEKKAEKEAKQKALEEEDLYTSNPEIHPDDSLPVEEPVKEERKEHSLLNRMKNAFFDDYEDESMVEGEMEFNEPVYSEPVVTQTPVSPVTPVASSPSSIASKPQ